MAARDLQERIKKLIVDRRLPSGAPLPTEPELMEYLGASRNSVREALKALQAMGIVEIRHGFGTYVGSMSFAPMIEGLAFRTVAGHYRGEDSLLQLLELREAVETGLVSRLAGRLPEADLVELNALVDRMEQEAAEGTGLAETDRAFHATLYRGLDNVLLSEVLEAFWDAFHRVQRDLVDVPQDPRVTCRQHREILDAVRSGDSLRAEEAIRDHFGNIRTRLSTTGASEPPEPHARRNERV
ncbi:FadR/GntR family transcriptional regulator [Streptomyces sp. NPDC059688]|uniref:FadR family transcriptional regulator n=1 Tax=Streptomyces albidocamelliae TaxID=2981135 RepID=A0ABY6ENU0_9ACTN|nr:MULTISPECIES: FadR/GntR family transcriptional regulator [unclassified Streptomyces]OKJ75571.1 GntR family transcriptional regulator [Streptomyces sp. CB01883]PKW08032.1 DNA-binding FadR family transcriptional regulator [Streptomyces sp. 5112.2]ROP52973.1 DNA-binding FadR family transcriptional regulator [Streptomyces sp. PanSC9]UXY36035.1 FadR family transcriptional regulator [Streptomyces sp. HUAS 14-6]SEC73738.1 DNA-binding transcriptional regulator, FadR family [Streptomyces sp. 1222.5]